MLLLSHVIEHCHRAQTDIKQKLVWNSSAQNMNDRTLGFVFDEEMGLMGAVWGICVIWKEAGKPNSHDLTQWLEAKARTSCFVFMWLYNKTHNLALFL